MAVKAAAVPGGGGASCCGGWTQCSPPSPPPCRRSCAAAAQRRRAGGGALHAAEAQDGVIIKIEGRDLPVHSSEYQGTFSTWRIVRMGRPDGSPGPIFHAGAQWASVTGSGVSYRSSVGVRNSLDPSTAARAGWIGPSGEKKESSHCQVGLEGRVYRVNHPDRCSGPVGRGRKWRARLDPMAVPGAEALWVMARGRCPRGPGSSEVSGGSWRVRAWLRPLALRRSRPPGPGPRPPGPRPRGQLVR